MSNSNTIPIEAWNSVLFDKFSRFRHVLTYGLSAHSDEVLGRRPFASGRRVLDVGCGFGDTTRLIARQVASGGASIGVDCAQRFIELANAELIERPVANASFFVADVECDDLEGPYDHVFSRFGTMFFNRPGAALRNIHKALAPGGTLSMIVWRRRQDNPWVHDAGCEQRRCLSRRALIRRPSRACGSHPSASSARWPFYRGSTGAGAVMGLRRDGELSNVPRFD